MKNSAVAGAGKRSAVCTALLLFCLLAFAGCIFGGNNTERSFDEVQKLFAKDRDAIDAAVNSGDYSAAAELDWIESANESKYYVDFYCGGSGMGSQTNYTGFFYTPDDDPLALFHESIYSSSMRADHFVRTAEGWEYRQSDHEPGDNYYQIRKLAPCYYYYYMHF